MTFILNVSLSIDVTHQVEKVVLSTSSDQLQIPSWHITRARAKRFKEALNEFIQDKRAKQMIQATINVKDQAVEGFLG